jgi:peptidoglycan/xylan/chitin deacetylase (PgdA/CDA1 family)
MSSLATSTISALGRALPGTRANRLLILIYHRVHATPDPMFPGEVDAKRFDWQMALLRERCHPLSLAESVTSLKDGELPPRAVAITFDDGYADNATIALPILKKHGLSATFFVATGFLDGGRMWNDSVIEAVRRAPAGIMRREEFGLPEAALGKESVRGAVAGEMLRAIKHRPPEERLARVEAFCRRIGATFPADLMMTSSQVRDLVDAGMAIGAHTVNHPILAALSVEQAREEISTSRRVLESITGRRVMAFAYPNGQPGDDYTERDRDIVRELGFDCALSTWWGVASRDSDRYQLPRFTPWDRSPDRWLARLLLAFSRPDTLSAAGLSARG